MGNTDVLVQNASSRNSDKDQSDIYFEDRTDKFGEGLIMGCEKWKRQSFCFEQLKISGYHLPR